MSCRCLIYGAKAMILVQRVQRVHCSLLPSPPPLNLQTVQAPLFRQFPLYVSFIVTPPPPPFLKNGFSSEPT